MIKKPSTLVFATMLFIALAAGRGTAGEEVGPGCRQTDDYTIIGPTNFLTGYPSMNADGTVNAVVEIPTGTSAKWEVVDDGRLIWEFKKGKPRVVKYLGYPGNYGMVPRTRYEDSQGVDIIILGPPVPRGSVVPVRLVGVLKFLDDGERDDKLLAVRDGDPLSKAKDIDDLEGKKFSNVV